MDQQNKKDDLKIISKEYIIITSIISFFIITLTLTSLYVYQLINSHNVCGCIIPLPYMLIGIGIIGIITGSTLNYFFFKEKLNKKTTIINQNPYIKYYQKIIPKEQQKILDYIIEKDSKKETVKQIDINKICNSRVKSHRILKELEQKEIINRKREGKCILIKLKT